MRIAQSCWITGYTQVQWLMVICHPEQQPKQQIRHIHFPEFSIEYFHHADFQVSQGMTPYLANQSPGKSQFI